MSKPPKKNNRRLKKQQKPKDVQPYRRPVPEYTDTKEKIKNFYFGLGENDLSESENNTLSRWLFVHKLILERLVKPHDVGTLVKMLTREYPGFSTRTYYKDVKNSKQVFGNIDPEERMYYSQLHYDWANECFNKCKALGQMTAAHKFLVLMEEIKRSQQPSPEVEKLRDILENRPTQIIVVVDPEQVGLKPYSKEEKDALLSELTIDLAETDYEVDG